MKLEISERFDRRQHSGRSQPKINPIDSLNLNDIMKNRIKFMSFSTDRFLGTVLKLGTI
jgi:hypothetical protein